jgi:putative ABC transport system permease protein
MPGNYLAAAVRNLARNKLNAALDILGLAAGFAAALLIALYVRHESAFETFLPGHEDVYRLSGAIDGSSAPDDTKGPIA